MVLSTTACHVALYPLPYRRRLPLAGLSAVRAVCSAGVLCSVGLRDYSIPGQERQGGFLAGAVAMIVSAVPASLAAVAAVVRGAANTLANDGVQCVPLGVDGALATAADCDAATADLVFGADGGDLCFDVG